MMIAKKALVLAVLAKSADAFSATSMTRTSSSTALASRNNNFNNKRVGALSMSSGEDDPVKITTVNSKEIFFDEKAGRFFETKLVSEDDENPGAQVSGPFKRGVNPLAKPQGSFFDELFAKGKSEGNNGVASPPPPAEEKAPAFGGFFQKQEEPSPQAPAAVPAPIEIKSVAPAAATEESPSPFSFLDGIFKPKEPEAPTAPAAVPAPVEIKSVAPAAATEEPPSPFSFLDGIFKPKEPEAREESKPIPYDAVTISPDFRVAAAFLGAGLLLDQIPYIQLTLGPLITLLGLLFLFQSFRVRLVFTENNELQLATIKNILTGETESPGENVVVGGANCWACDTIVNYDFFPAIDSSPVGPILVYFKETQTPSESWNDGPGAIANSGEDKVQGQVHFLPAICSSEQIQEEFAKRGCGKV
jgi:hypothetical protein